MSVKKAVILCGGLATRMLPITKTVPKEMLPILNRPAIDYCVQDLKENGVTEILVILGRDKESLEKYYDRNVETEARVSQKPEYSAVINSMFEGVNVYFMRQRYAKGTGFALLEARNFVGDEPFILIFPDELLLNESYAGTLIKEYQNTGKSVIPLKQVPIKESVKYGMVAYTKDKLGNKIERIVEKPKPENSPSDVCYTGGGLFTSEVFDCVDVASVPEGQEVVLTNFFDVLIKRSGMYGVYVTGERMDIGNPLGFVKANVMTALQDKKIGPEFREFIKNLAKDLK